MPQDMMFSELVEATKSSHLARQLLYLKRCFGCLAKIGIVTSKCEVDRCGTIAELVNYGHIPCGMEWMDPFLAAIPTVYEIPFDDFTVVQSRYSDGGPPCPWEVARREQEEARVRAVEKRRKSRI